MSNLPVEIFAHIGLYCDRVTKTTLLLINRNSLQGYLDNHKKEEFFPGQCITIKDKCRSNLFPSFPIDHHQELQYSLIIDWDTIKCDDFDLFLRYRTYKEINLFINKFGEEIVNKFYASKKTKPVRITFYHTFGEILRQNKYTFSNKRLDVLEYLASIILPQKDHIDKMTNPMFLHTAFGLEDSTALSRFVSISNAEHLGVLYTSLCKWSDNRYVTMEFTRKNLCLIKPLMVIGCGINFVTPTMIYDDKSTRHKSLNDNYFEEFINIIITKEKLQGTILSLYIDRFGIQQGCLKYRARFGTDQKAYGDKNVMYGVLNEYNPSLETIKWFISEGFTLPEYLPHIKQSSDINTFKWLFEEGVKIMYSICRMNLKEIYAILDIGYVLSEEEIGKTLSSFTDSWGVKSMCQEFLDLLAQYKYKIGEEALDHFQAKFQDALDPNIKAVITSIASYPYLLIDKEDLLFIIDHNYNQCLYYGDRIAIYHRRFYPKIKTTPNPWTKSKSRWDKI